jgi:hypothetical protein
MDDQPEGPDQPELKSLRLRMALPPPGQSVHLVPIAHYRGPSLGPGIMNTLMGGAAQEGATE